MDINKLVIVTGSMRSGTTLLGELLQPRDGLSNHPSLTFDNDRINFVKKLSESYRQNSDLNDWLSGDFCREYSYSEDVTLNFLGEQVFDKCISEENLKKAFRAAFVEELLNKNIQSSDFLIAGIKSTHLFNEIDLMGLYFDEVKPILVIRDPRDILASNINRVHNRYPIQVALMILATLAAYQELIAQPSFDKWGVVKYESLVSSPATVMSYVLNFIGVDESLYNWRYLKDELVGSNSSYNTGRGLKIISNSGITGESIGAYQDHLPPILSYAVERLLFPLMNQFGYLDEILINKKYEGHMHKIFSNDLFFELKKRKVSGEALKNRLVSIGFGF